MYSENMPPFLSIITNVFLSINSGKGAKTCLFSWIRIGAWASWAATAEEKPRCCAGEQCKVLLASSLCQRAHLYLWDEPLNYIDVFSRMQIEKLLLKAAPSLLFVEHDAAFVERVATGVVPVRG